MTEATPVAADQSDAPAPEVASQDEPVNLQATPDVSEPEEQVQISQEDDHEEVEYEGSKYRVPKALKDGFLRQSDYTRKTQEVAEQRRTFEAEQAAFKQQSEAAQRHIQSVAEVYAINAQIGQIEQDWQKAQTDGDPFKASELFQQRAFLVERRNNLGAQIQHHEQQRSLETQQDFAKRYAETNQRLLLDIHGWEEVAPKVAKFAQANGVDPATLREIATNVALTKLLHKAYSFDQLSNAKTAQAKAPPPTPSPITKISGGGARSTVTPETATDMETYARLRKAQGYGKR